jgi:hypothetical protein
MVSNRGAIGAGWIDAIVVTQAESCGIMVPFS